MQKRLHTEVAISRAIREARTGDFTYLLGEDAERWWAFVGDRIEMGSDELMIRIDLDDDSSGPWFMWLVLSVEDSGKSLSLKQVCIPDSEGNPEAALSVPVGREQIPYFVLQ
jgi:hypothetical protein